ncbi:hypothetical protein [Streptomyces sp. NPDC047706]
MAETLARLPTVQRMAEALAPERRTPLPAPRRDSGIVSAVEWV